MKAAPPARARALRDAHWLTADRLNAATQVWIFVMAGILSSIPWTKPTMQIGRDFAAFWVAARLAWDGQAASSYGDAEPAMLVGMFGGGGYPPFFYPPVALLLWLPFAALPFAAAMAIWLCLTGAAFAAAIRSVAGSRMVVTALACPAAIVCGLYGQNGLLSAALLGAAAATLERSPVVAGMLIGCFAYKPQLAVLAPVTLALAGRWRAFAGAAVTAVVLIAFSMLAFGVGSWTAFIAALPRAEAWNANGVPGFGKFVSPYAAMRLLGASAAWAWEVQGVCAAAVLALLVLVVRRRPGGSAEIVMMVATLAFWVPFLGEYDLPIFAIPAAWLVSEAVRTGWLPYERLTVMGLYLAPAVVTLASGYGVPLGPPALAVLTVSVARRMPRRELGRR